MRKLIKKYVFTVTKWFDGLTDDEKQKRYEKMRLEWRSKMPVIDVKK